MTIDKIRRRPCVPGMVRYIVRLHTQESELLYRPSCKIHPLEVRLLSSYHAWCRDLTRETCQRQTVFYTPTTVTISEGQKIRGRVSCSPNTKNNRDLDIIIAYETDETEETVVEYKMCVVFPYLYALRPRLVNFADRRLGVDCIFISMLSCSVVLARRNLHFTICACCLNIFRWLGVASNRY